MEWKDITLGMFAQVQAITKSESPDLTKKIELYSLLTGKDMDEVREVPLGEFLAAYSKELTFLSSEIPQVVPQFWEHKEIKYKICTQVEKLTAGQYIDLKEAMKEQNSLHKIMAVLCYDGEKYDGATHAQRADLFNANMPITIAYPLAVFFFELWNAWSEVSLRYSNQILNELKAGLQQNTAG